MIMAKYSLGSTPDTMVNDYLDCITCLENMGEEGLGYIFFLWMVALGILLEVNKEELKRLACIIENKKIEDALIDFLLKACNIEWQHYINTYQKENPYSKTAEIIEIALHNKDKEEASKRLQKYMDKERFKGHYYYEWRNAQKEPC